MEDDGDDDKDDNDVGATFPSIGIVKGLVVPAVLEDDGDDDKDDNDVGAVVDNDDDDEGAARSFRAFVVVVVVVVGVVIVEDVRDEISALFLLMISLAKLPCGCAMLRENWRNGGRDEGQWTFPARCC